LSRGIVILLAAAFATPTAWPCDTVVIAGQKKVDVASDVVKKADVILRATAVGFTAPSDVVGPIRFKVNEIIRGQPISELVLTGAVVDVDDFNHGPSPYQSGRPSPSCVGFTYKPGSQYLLLLKKDTSGQLTPDWYLLAPVNEELHGDDDQWLLWVRQQAQKR
jgi:hypothetical protein